MKKIVFSLMLVGAVLAGCTKPSTDRPQDNKPNEEKPNEENNGGNEQQPEEKPTAECDWADFLITAEFTADPTTGYEVGQLDYATATNKDGKTVATLLGYGSYNELAEALGEDPLSGDVQYFGNDPATGYDFSEAFNTNGVGYWCNGQGSLSSWGDDASRIYTEFFYSDETGFLSSAGGVGVRPDHIKTGETYTCRMVWQKVDGETVARVGVEFKVTIQAFVDPEADSYDASKRQTGTFDLPTVELNVPINVFYNGVTADMSAIQQYLQLTKYEITQLPAATYDDETGELLKGLDLTNYVNGEAVAPNAGGLGGNWMADTTTVGAWGTATGAWFIEFQADSEAIYIAVGTMPGDEGEITDLVAALEGQTAEYKQVLTYIPEFDAAPTVINMTYKINFTAAE